MFLPSAAFCILQVSSAFGVRGYVPDLQWVPRRREINARARVRACEGLDWPVGL